MWEQEKKDFERMIYLVWMDGQKSFSITGKIKDKNSEEFRRI